MNDDTQLERYLSGDTSLDALPDALQSEERRLRALVDTVRHHEPARPELFESVMQTVSTSATPGWKRAVDWLFNPREIRVSPALAGVALAAIAAAIILVPGVEVPTGDAVAGTTPEASGVVTRFVFIAPEARSVSLTGDFVEWDADGIPLQQPQTNGVWTLDVPLEPGVYEYAFIIDGQEWRPDPLAMASADDGFGMENSVVIVAEGRT